MNLMTERDAARDNANREELRDRIEMFHREEGVVEPMSGIRLTRAKRPSARMHGISRASLCVIAQGVKEVLLGGRQHIYDSGRYLLATAELPVTGRIVEATALRPYLAIRLDLEPSMVGSVMVESGLPPTQGHSKAIIVSELDSGLLDATVRLARLLDAPAETRMLLPLIKREIVFRLLIGEQGNRLRHLPTIGGNSDRVAQAIDTLHRNYNKPLRIDSLAKELGMSSSGFHHHFKAVTDMSPLQFQKELRLQEARRLMLGESLDAASAGYRVGYEDPSHFSRDYKKHFGAPPVQDVGRFRAMAVPETDV